MSYNINQNTNQNMNKNTKNLQSKDALIRVLYAAFEAAPFAKTGGLGEVAGSLPQALAAFAVDARLIMPKFGSLPAAFAAQLKHVADFTLPLAWRKQYCGVEKLELDGRTVYFIDNEYYFKRAALYGFGDDAERIAFFAKAVVAAIPHLAQQDGFAPQVLHCNDWHTALSPVYLREQYRDEPACRGVKAAFSVHNLKFQGQYDPFILGDVLGLDNTPAAGQLLHNGAVNYMHGALCYADRLLTVSPTYAQEVCQAAYGEGLQGLFCARQSVLGGILNGIDTAVYDPGSDAYLPAHFSPADLSGKVQCKRAVQRDLGLPQADVPLLVLISRLTEQKGLDLLLPIMDELLGLPVQVAVLGVGDAHYEQTFAWLDAAHTNFAARLLFDDGWAHRLYAGADMLLMPSQFEPCGLAQMIAMRYGTLPIVRETGGLKDSVQPYNRYTGAGNGFSFANYNAQELLATIRLALAAYDDAAAWGRLVQNAMAADFSWQRSAGQYADVYRQLINQ